MPLFTVYSVRTVKYVRIIHAPNTLTAHTHAKQASSDGSFPATIVEDSTVHTIERIDNAPLSFDVPPRT